MPHTLQYPDPAALNAICAELGITLPALHQELVRRGVPCSYGAVYKWALGRTDPGLRKWLRVDRVLVSLRRERRTGPAQDQAQAEAAA